MIKVRNGLTFVIWMISFILVLASFSPWIAPRSMLQNIGGASAILIFFVFVIFRSKYYERLISSTPRRKISAGIALVSKLVTVYAASLTIFFVTFWLLTSSISIYANVMLSPFGAFAFYMGRWINFRP